MSGSSVNTPSDFSGKERSKHTSAHRTSTQLKYLKRVYCRWLGKQVGKEKCVGGAGGEELVINFVLDMLRGESDLLKENKRENTGVRKTQWKFTPQQKENESL